MKMFVDSLDGHEFEIHMDGAATILDVKEKLIKEQGLSEGVAALELVHGGNLLDDTSTLSDALVTDSDTLTLLKRKSWPMMELLVNIADNTQWHGYHKFALRSAPLGGEVEQISVTVDKFSDQGWGGCQARLFIYLYTPDGKEVAQKLIFGPLRTEAYDVAKHGDSPACTLGDEEPVVALAKHGMIYKLRYQNGGGGGHSIKVRGWSCRVIPKVHDKDAASVKLSSEVELRERNRCGPDTATGLWELTDPVEPQTLLGFWKDDDHKCYQIAFANDACVFSGLNNSMKGMLSPSGGFFVGEVSTDKGQLQVRVKANSPDEIVFEIKKDGEDTWFKQTLCRYSEGLINPSEVQRSYSSVFNHDALGTGHSRSMLDSPQAWSAKNNAAGEWMQLDLGKKMSIRGLVVQGRQFSPEQCVREFRVSHSSDGTGFEDLAQTYQYQATNLSAKEEALFVGGAVHARYIRLTVLKWQSHVSMRVGVLEEINNKRDGEVNNEATSSGYQPGLQPPMAP